MSDNQGVVKYKRQALSSHRWLFATTIILLMAAAFRLILLDGVPPGLAQDEILDADIARFIREGEHALFFSHGYGHEPLYHYFAAPFAPLFGDNLLAIRLPSVFLGLLLVALTMSWAKREYGALAAVIAGLGLAVSWWPVIFSRIGIRPILEPVLIVLAVWFWPLDARAVSRTSQWRAVLAGLLLGLSIYAYTAARIILLIPAVLFIIWSSRYLWLRYRKWDEAAIINMWQARMVYAAIILLVGLAVYMPMALTLRARPELQQRLEQLEGPVDALRQWDLGPVLEMTKATIGVYSFTGDPRWTYSLPNRPLFDPVTAILFYGGLLITVWKWKRPVYLILPVWLVVTMLPSALSPDAPSTVRLIGALPVVYLLPGIAIDTLYRWQSRFRTGTSNRQGLVFAILLTLILLFNGYRTVRDGFIRWPRELETRIRYQTVLRDIARHWAQLDAGFTPVVAEVFFEPIDADTLRRNIGGDPAARWIQTGAGVAGALVWPNGGDNRLYVPEFAPVDDSLLGLAAIPTEPIYRSEGTPSFAVYELGAAPSLGPVPLHVEFGEWGQIVLKGVDKPASQENNMTLATSWLVKDTLPADLAIFIHLVDENENIVSQYDGLDAIPSTLRAGDVILQRHVIGLSASMKDGVYTLRLGIYQRANGQRLTLEGGLDSIKISVCTYDSDGTPRIRCSLTEIE